MSSNPIFTDCPADQWTLVSSAVTGGFINRVSTAPDKYLWCYRLAGDPVPTSASDGITIFDKDDVQALPDSSGLDIYIYPQGGVGRIRLDNITRFADIASKTAFGELDVSSFDPLTGWAFTYNINPALINQEVVTTGVITNLEGHAILNSGSSATGHAKIDTVRSSRYIPGVGGVARFTAIFSTPQEDSQQVIGLINGADGWAFGYNGTQFGILRKRNGVENWIYQEDWNVDKKINFDPTKGNVFQIKYQWLGYGMQYFYMEDENGNLSLVHRIRYSNENTGTSITNPNLPLSAYVINAGNTIPIELKTPSAIAGLSGDGLNDAISTNVTGKSVRNVTAGDAPFLAFRLSDIYKGKANRLFSQGLRLVTAADLNKTVTIDAYAGGTVNDGTWVYASEEVSPIEVNNTLTSYSPGLLIGSFPLGKTDSKDFPLGDTKFKFYAGQQIVLVASTAGAGEVRASVNWKSFV